MLSRSFWGKSVFFPGLFYDCVKIIQELLSLCSVQLHICGLLKATSPVLVWIKSSQVAVESGVKFQTREEDVLLSLSLHV